MHALQSPPSYVARSAAVAKYHHTALPAIGAIAAAGTHRRRTAAPTTAPTMNTKSNVAGKLITRVIDQPAPARELDTRAASTSKTAELDGSFRVNPARGDFVVEVDKPAVFAEGQIAPARSARPARGALLEVVDTGPSCGSRFPRGRGICATASARKRALNRSPG